MLVRFAFIFFFVSLSLVHASGNLLKELAIKTQICTHLCRVLTQRGGLYEDVRTDHQFLFGSGIWSRGLSYEHKEPSESKNFLLHPDTDLAHFHDKLGEKLISIADKVGCEKLQRMGKLPIEVSKSKQSGTSFETKIKPNFANGHCLKVDRQTTRYNKVLISLYQEVDEKGLDDGEEELIVAGKIIKKQQKPQILRWFLPIEQVFFLPTLDDYKKSVALLSRWSAYSRFALMVLPRGTKISAYTGVVAPQLLIENTTRADLVKKYGISGYEDEVKSRIEEAEEYLKKLKHSNLDEDKITKVRNSFNEFYPGGATQIYVDFAEKYYLFDINALFRIEGDQNEKLKPFNPNFSTERKVEEKERLFGNTKRIKTEEVWFPPVAANRNSHFLYDNASVKIHMHEGLKGLFSNGQFDAEKEEIDRILKHLEKLKREKQ
jgi:hypothetical protein